MENDKSYCIYTDTYTDKTHGNWDHIIPIAFGGCNQFTTWSSKSFNSEFGSKVEAKLLNDIIIPFAIRNAGIKGRNNKGIEPSWRSYIGNEPVITELGKEEIKHWSVKTRKYLSNSETEGVEFNTKFNINIHNEVRFLCKVCLGGAYKVYGDLIRDTIWARKLRHIIHQEHFVEDDSNLDGIKINWRFREKTSDGALEEKLCEFTKRSVFCVSPDVSGLVFSIGICGYYLGSIIIDDTVTEFPMGIDFENKAVGNVMLLKPGKFEAISYRRHALNLAKNLNIEIPDGAILPEN